MRERVCVLGEGGVEVKVFSPYSHPCPSFMQPFWTVGMGGSWGMGVKGGVGETRLTNGHEGYDQLGVGDVGTAHSGPADSLADVRVYTAHLVYRRSDSR